LYTELIDTLQKYPTY